MNTRLAVLLAPVALLPVVLLAAAGGGIASVAMSSGGPGQPAANASAVRDIPPQYLALYQQAATTECRGLSWTILAAIGEVESDHGRSRLPGVLPGTGTNEAGAAGPMQFLRPTFDQYSRPVPAGGQDPPSPYNPVNAIHAAARMLCANGALDNRDTPGAIFSYNHADWYVTKVLQQAQDYAAAHDQQPAAAPNEVAAKALSFANAQLGLPYVWGGNGPELTELPNGETTVTGGFDCSGLTTAAYAAAGVQLPRTAQTQYDHGPKVPAGQPLMPGDLLFFGTPANVHHVGIYLSTDFMIDAPNAGEKVGKSFWRDAPDYIGATRPGR